MIVERLSLRNWRNYRELRTFEFSEGLNLLVGPNESGKSTVFEALTRALFDRHGSKARELRRVQPLGSSLGPEVEIVFRTGDERYRLKKRFLVDPMSELYSEREGGFELDHDGDRSDGRVRELLGGERPHGVSRAEHRGLAQALWYLQSEAPVPEKAWSDALEQGLGALLEVVLRTSEEDAICAAAEKEYRSWYTRSGRPSKRSELYRLEEELPQLEEDLRRRRSELERAEALRQQLGELQGQLAVVEQRIHEASPGLEALAEEVEKARSLEEERRSREAEISTAAERVHRLEGELQAQRRRDEEIAALEAELDEERAAEKRAGEEVRQHRRTAETHTRRQEKELAPRLAALGQTAADLRSRLRVEQLDRERELLQSIVGKRDVLLERRAKLEREAECLRAPDDKAWQDLRRRHAELERLRNRLEAGAVRLAIRIKDGSSAADGGAVVSDPEAARDAQTGELLITRPTRLELPGGIELVVRSGDDSLERLGEQAARLERRLGEALESWAAESFADLEERVEQKGHLEGRLTSLDERLGELLEESAHGSPEARLREVSRELAELRRLAPQALLPGMEGWAKEQTDEQLAEIEQERARVEQQVVRERSGEHEAQQKLLEASERLREATRRAEALRARLRSLREQATAALENYGTLEKLVGQLEGARGTLSALREQYDVAMRDYAERVERPRERLTLLRGELDALRSEQDRLREEATDRMARIEEVAELGLHSRCLELEGRAERQQRRLAVVQRRASAAALLYDLIERRRRQRSTALAAPVSELVDEWLRPLTGEAYGGLALDERLLPVGVTSQRYAESLPLESLSYGTQEQVAVLLRLAIAVLLSREERQLVVLDDRLVNADLTRLERLCSILEDVSGDCQILLATCRPELYEGLAEARVLEVAPGRPSEREPEGDLAPSSA